MNLVRSYRIAAAAALVFAALSSSAYAHSGSVAAEAATMDKLAARLGGARAQESISGDFSAFAGSAGNARKLVAGLRRGRPVTLERAHGAVRGDAVTIVPPTGPMSYGDVYTALALTRQRLAAQGISNPTPWQMQYALVGGAALGGNPPKPRTTRGVLQLRNDGESWAEIADHYGLRLGTVFASMQALNHRLSAMTAATSASAAGSASAMTAIASGAGRRSTLAPAVNSGADFDFDSRSAISGNDATAGVDARGSMRASAGAGIDDASLNAIGHVASHGLGGGILR